ncbi:conserved protein [Tepidicaulis marinus]|uniref:Conserved protein n=1 Tax=Tepidicaulis marinus TaxID=1333998 RepID=A0A081BDE1_9HYPH|nr:hypothetical protein [Tepidicaulis marinus]GAK46059.1 conserved protein [Tepidicaulis marinus]
MHELMVFFLTLVTGYVAAGLTGSFYRLVTNKPASFQMWQESTAGLVMGVCTLVFAGPTVILRNAMRAQVIENRPPFWLLLSTLIASFWSFLVGIFILSLVLA